MTRYGWYICWWLVGGLAFAARAQAPVGDGLQGEYFDGRNFEHPVLTRRDPVINFDWHQQRPVAGLGAEEFSVRWTGWLVAPATGRYVLHISVDDGMRFWLNGRQLLNEWRGQPLSYYQLAVDLKAGEAYPLRIDYCQYSYSTRARLAWETPAQPTATSSWRNLWGVTHEQEGPVVIPTRYLFSHRPAAIPTPPPVASPAPVPLAERRAPAPLLATSPSQPALAKPWPRSYLRPVASVPPPASRPPTLPDSGRVAALATRLDQGQALTLRTLYFEQGKTELLPPVQASLDTLASALASRPALRLEVQGHTDNQGDPAINYRLSEQRAQAVCQYLAAHGVAASRLRAVGFGGTRPVADNRLPEQRFRNRRVVVQPSKP